MVVVAGVDQQQLPIPLLHHGHYMTLTATTGSISSDVDELGIPSGHHYKQPYCLRQLAGIRNTLNPESAVHVDMLVMLSVSTRLKGAAQNARIQHPF